MEERVHAKEGVMIFSMLVTVMLGCTPSLARDPSCVTQPPRTFITTKNTSCYQDFCTCTTNTADCSRNFGRLTFLPVLPETVENVVFSFNNLIRIQDDHFFGNISMIQCLDMQHNGLEFISTGAFRVFTGLRKLLLDHNRLSYAALTPVFVANQLLSLHISRNGLGPLPSGYFVRTSLLCLAELDLSKNNLQHLNLSELEPLTGLRELSAVDSRIGQVTTGLLPQLIFLNLGLNALFDLPDSCGSSGSSLFPRLKELRFERNKLVNFRNQICLPNLEKLELNRNSIGVIETDMFNETRFPNLVHLSLGSMNVRQIEAFAFRNPSLKALSLMYCNMHLSVVAHPASFTGISNLEFLQVSHNFAADVSEHTFCQLFSAL